MYNRILIVGSTASGKTGLAKMLSNIFNLSLYSTDDFVYKEKHIVIVNYFRTFVHNY